MTPRARRITYFWLGILLGIASHSRVMSYTAMAAAYIPFKYAPTIADRLYMALMVLALLGSALLVVSSWWLSVYRKHSAPLITTMLTGVAAFMAADAVGNRHYDASWLALVLIAVVLFAGIDNARLLRRELVTCRGGGDVGAS